MVGGELSVLGFVVGAHLEKLLELKRGLSERGSESRLAESEEGLR